MEKSVVITTNRETAQSIESVFNSRVLEHRTETIKLGNVSHYETYSTVQLIPENEDEALNAENLFWIGLYTGLNSK